MQLNLQKLELSSNIGFEYPTAITSYVNRSTIKLIIFLSFMGTQQNKFNISKEEPHKKLEIRWKNTAVGGSSSAVLWLQIFFLYGAYKSIIIVEAQPYFLLYSSK